jgi:hypothetical protein
MTGNPNPMPLPSQQAVCNQAMSGGCPPNYQCNYGSCCPSSVTTNVYQQPTYAPPMQQPYMQQPAIYRPRECVPPSYVHSKTYIARQMTLSRRISVFKKVLLGTLYICWHTVLVALELHCLSVLAHSFHATHTLHVMCLHVTHTHALTKQRSPPIVRSTHLVQCARTVPNHCKCTTAHATPTVHARISVNIPMRVVPSRATMNSCSCRPHPLFTRLDPSRKVLPLGLIRMLFSTIPTLSRSASKWGVTLFER